MAPFGYEREGWWREKIVEIRDLLVEIAANTKATPAHVGGAEWQWWRELHAQEMKSLMILHERRDILDAAGLIIGDSISGAVPWLVQEYDRLRIKAGEHA